MKHIVIIGGGFAGLSAAVALTGKGVKVTLLEGRKHLGGRAYSFADSKTGDTLDNGQHLFMGCYHSTLDFLSVIGSREKIQFQNRFEIEFHHHTTGLSRLSFPNTLPSPFHVIYGLLKFRPIRAKDILGLRRVERALSSTLETDVSADTWLNDCGQSPQIRKSFWDPLCLSTLNADPRDAPARHLTAVLKEAFFGKRADSFLGHSKVGLSDLYTDASKNYIEAGGGQVCLESSVAHISISSDTTVKIHQRIEPDITADAFICATPPPALTRLLPENGFARLKQTLSCFSPSAILSVNLWFDRQVMQAGYLGLLDATMDWIFNRNELLDDGTSIGQVTMVASAANHLAGVQEDGLVKRALQDLRAAAPLSESATLLHKRVMREPRATFLLQPGIVAPSWQTEHPGLFLAGDWVDTGLPATIESAVISGKQAAHQALSYLRRN